MNGFESLFDRLNKDQVRYVLVGGLAVVLHGYARLTADVDLVVDLAPKEAARAIDALIGLGFKPRPPVNARDFADPAIRRTWAEEKGMMVFTMFDPTNPMRVVDLFAVSPMPFGDLWSRSTLIPLAHSSVRVASIEDLIRIKREAGRARDLDDVRVLDEIRRKKSRG